jgi:hypoxanthine phosphoribosyltransferase
VVGDASPETEDGDKPPARRRRRGHRGGVGRRRQTAEQAVAGISPVPKPAEEPLKPAEEPLERAEEPLEPADVDLPAAVLESLGGEQGDAEAEEAEREEGREEETEWTDRRRRGERRKPKTLAELDTGPSNTADLSFMHPSEHEFANLLDYYQIKYLYEPRSFPLRWDGNRVVEMHTPDFYLPEYDQYFELTTMKQNLTTQKNRKLRHVKELYPEVNIQLLYRRDLMRLMGKYGFGPLAEVDVEGTEQVLFSEERVQARVRALGKQITEDYAGQEPVLIGVLRGVVVFMADLMRQINLPTQIEFMEISHYGEEREESIEILRDVTTDIKGRPVILVEDIVDTGLTLRYVLEHLNAKNPSSIKVCALLDKSVRRMARIPLEYVGFQIPDEFVIGYGLDYGGRYRNLPYVGVLKPAEPKAVAQR